MWRMAFSLFIPDCSTVQFPHKLTKQFTNKDLNIETQTWFIGFEHSFQIKLMLKLASREQQLHHGSSFKYSAHVRCTGFENFSFSFWKEWKQLIFKIVIFLSGNIPYYLAYFPHTIPIPHLPSPIPFSVGT